MVLKHFLGTCFVMRVRGKGFVCGYIYYAFAFLFVPRVTVPREDAFRI